MWHVFQALIVFAVVASNIHWEWTPNKTLAAFLGIALAFVVTALICGLRDLLRKNRVGRDQGLQSLESRRR